MDTLEPLFAKKFDVANRLGNGTVISFCSWTADLDLIKEESIRSIDNIGRELGFTYEIIVTGGIRHITGNEEKHKMMRKKRTPPGMRWNFLIFAGLRWE